MLGNRVLRRTEIIWIITFNALINLSVSQRDFADNAFDDKYIAVPLDFKSLRYRSGKLPKTEEFNAKSNEQRKEVKEGITWNGYNLPTDTTSDIIRKILHRLAQFNREEYCPFQDPRACRKAGSDVVNKIIEVVIANNKKMDDADDGYDERVGFEGNRDRNGNNKNAKGSYINDRGNKQDIRNKGNRKNPKMALRKYIFDNDQDQPLAGYNTISDVQYAK